MQELNLNFKTDKIPSTLFLFNLEYLQDFHYLHPQYV